MVSKTIRSERVIRITHPNISSIQKQTESAKLRRVCLLNLLSLLLRVAVVARGHLEIDISRKSKKQALTCHRLQLEEGDYYQSGTQLGCSVFGADWPGINKPLNRLSNSKTIPTDLCSLIFVPFHKNKSLILFMRCQ